MSATAPPQPPVKDGLSRIVGIGASAGGLEAIKAFFDNVPDDSQHSYVLLQHLSPDYKSLMGELLRKNTELPIIEVTDESEVKPGSVYLVPPAKNLELTDGKLHLTDKPDSTTLNLPIDLFFRSLAKSEQERAIGIILTGTGSDGTRGVRALKDAGGMVMVQDPRQAAFDGMPLSAMATGLADYVLPVEKMPGELQRFVSHPASLGGGSPDDTDVLGRILARVRDVTGVDFGHYKHPTLIRRAERRMSVRDCKTLSEYLTLIDTDAQEAETLSRECLICVTRFFRDGDVWDSLRDNVLPDIVAECAAENRTVRVWSVGCSTGEEAYTVAMLLQEELVRQNATCDLKVFATDLSEQHLAVASRGAFPESIVADVWPERLSKFFLHSAGEYVVKDVLRSNIIFSPHNIIKDPPFKDVDLVLCRNLLIYLQPHAQRRALAAMHYALRPEGVLMLAPSEDVGDILGALTEVDGKARIYKNSKPSKRFGFDTLGGPDPAAISQTRVARLPGAGGRAAEALAEALTGEFELAAVFVDESFDIIHAVGDISRFAGLPSAGFTSNLLKLLDPGLSATVGTAIRQAKLKAGEVRYTGTFTKEEKGTQKVEVFVRPFALDGPGWRTCFAVVITPSADRLVPAAIDETETLDSEQLSRVEAIEQELQDTRRSLQTAIEQAETSNEELQSTNEELMAANEELQSTNEELQSMNEELHTVNAEHRQKISDLAELNADMDNLLASTEIGTIFLDGDLNIRRFTPVVQQQFNLRLSDIGRPLSHFTNIFTQADNQRLLGEAREVFETGEARDADIDTPEHQSSLVKLAPFEARSGEIEGVVMSFVDISDLKEAQAEFAHQNMVLRQVLDGAQAGHWEYDPETGVAVLSPSARVLLGHEPDEKIGKGNELRAVVHPGDAEILTDQLQQVAFSADVWEVDLRCQHSGGATLWFRCRARWEPTMERVVGALVDVTSLKEVESELIRSNDELRQFAYLTSHDLQEPLRTVSNFVEVLQNRYTDTIDEDGRQYLGIVSQATARMQALIRGILDYSRIGHDAVRSVVDIGAVILEATADLATAVEEAGAEIDVRPLPKVVGYEAELRMLFTNLLSNALKFRRPEVPLQITISAETEDQGWRVSVADNGIGIAAEHQDRIFEIFNRLHNRDSYEGAGIGLAHCRKIVELHGGVLAVDSEPGQGSAFSFVLNLSDGVDP